MIINRRQWITNEEERLEQRRAVRERVAALELAALRAKELDQTIAEVGKRLDSLAAEHESEVAPIQEELQQVEQRLISCLADRKPTNKKDEDRRKQLLADLHSANARLQKAIEDEKRLIGPLEQERDRERKKAVALDAERSMLARPPLANPQLDDRLYVAQRKSEAMVAWRNSARKKLTDAESSLAAIQRKNANFSPSPWTRPGEHSDGKQDTSEIQARIARHQLEVGAADEACGEASREREAAYQQVLDE